MTIPVLQPSSKDEDSTTGQMPLFVKNKLTQLGLNGELESDHLLHVETDLDLKGRWGKRYLVATPTRLIVLSEENNRDRQNGAKKILLLKRGVEPELTVDLDLLLEKIESAEAKKMVGASSIEIHLKPNGDDGDLPQTIEAVRASAAFDKTLEHIARQIEHLRQHGVLGADPQTEDASWVRDVCPRCGRALPEGSNLCAFCSNKWMAMARLLSYLKPYTWLVIANLFSSLIAITLSFAPPFAIAYLTDHVLPNPKQILDFVPTAIDYRMLWIVILLMLAAQFFSMVANIIHGRGVAVLGTSVLHDIRTQLYGHLQHLSIAYFDKREVGSIMTRVQNDVQMLQNFLLDGVESLVVATLTVAIVLALMFSRSWHLALAVLIPVPFVVASTKHYWHGLMRLWRRVWHQNSILGARLADTLGGVRVVRAFAQEDREADRFIDRSGQLRDATKLVEVKAANFYPVLGFIMGIGAPITWLVGGYEVLQGTLSLGGLLFFTMLLGRLYEPIQQLTRMINVLTRAMTSAERVFEVLDTKSEVQDMKDAISVPQLRGEVQFRNVSFGYDIHNLVLHDVNFNVEAGQMIGLVGHSGAGKSTLINLLMRFYDVSEGSILVDGHDLRAINHNDLRRQIGVVLQESYLFHGSIFDNIAYAKSDATPREVIEAAKAAHAHDFIVGFPDGYDSLVGERGMRLSGGERQRIAIARAILHNPRILILDEATASVDTQTEQQIQLALENLIRGRTTIAIAHRLSTLRNADKLIVIDGGKVKEEGSHDELMAAQGTFYNLVNAQQALNTIVTIGG
ncbi:MAG: ABC transporter ATP-binding protein [Abditibacteriaceae bacterium]